MCLVKTPVVPLPSETIDDLGHKQVSGTQNSGFSERFLIDLVKEKSEENGSALVGRVAATVGEPTELVPTQFGATQ